MSSTTRPSKPSAAHASRMAWRRAAIAGMGDGLQDLAARGIGEHEGAEALPVELRVGPRDVGPELLDDGAPGRLARRHDLARQHVGVDEPAAQLGELAGSRWTSPTRCRR